MTIPIPTPELARRLSEQGEVVAEPTLRALSLGAGVQSTTLALMATEGVLPCPDVAIFADTGWEPRKVYDHLDRLAAVLAEAGVPVVRVRATRAGRPANIRDDALTGRGGLALPVFVEGDDGRAAMRSRDCTRDYKLRPILREVRRRLGARTTPGGVVLTPPTGRWAEQWIGFSVDEIGRVKPSRVRYSVNRYPLLELGMSRSNCSAWLSARGWSDVPKSACVGCPFHGNRHWREMRATEPVEWADAVRFDTELRTTHHRGLNRPPYLHRSLLPLAEAPLGRDSYKDRAADQGDLFDLLEDGDPDGCSPHGCRSGVTA